jgi:hypothetical protein
MYAATGALNWVSDDIRVALSTSPALPSVNGTVYLSTMPAECSGGNYVRKQLANKSVVEDTSAECAKLMADNVTWTALNAGTIATVWIYVHNALDSAAVVLAVLDPGDLVTNGGDVVAKWDNQSSAGKLMTI